MISRGWLANHVVRLQQSAVCRLPWDVCVSADRLYDRNFSFACLSQVGFSLVNMAILAHYPRWIAFHGGKVDAAGWITGKKGLYEFSSVWDQM